MSVNATSETGLGGHVAVRDQWGSRWFGSSEVVCFNPDATDVSREEGMWD